ncbi:hypothetical protein L6452_34758 [Arctium lappa]|uniref:Uncharacterized protein n=1 Tax=Arctium lappa TaxID=4217 RepID=A0ACB8YNC0_ARCLA|nr:hypothetical protein L6452_34758 [Arctium lappa]
MSLLCENESSHAVDKMHHQVRRAPSFSGPLNHPNQASGNSLSAPIKPSGGYRDSLDDKSKANLVQIKGCFSMTSEDLDLVKTMMAINDYGHASEAVMIGKPVGHLATVDDRGKKLLPQSLQLYELLPHAIQDQLMLGRDPHVNVQAQKSRRSTTWIFDRQSNLIHLHD